MALLTFGKKNKNLIADDIGTVTGTIGSDLASISVDTSSIHNFLNKDLNIPKEEKEPEPKKKEEEWIWVEGYKGTDKDMCCRGCYYSLGVRYDMGEDAKIEECESGFHLCRDLKDVFSYYSVGDGNRYFKVKALVRKNDYETYNKLIYGSYLGYHRRDKLAARSIEFVSELTADEIFETLVGARTREYVVNGSVVNFKEFTKNDKKKAIDIGIDKTWIEICHRKLIRLGYSKAFAAYIIHLGRFESAYAVGTQEDLSMDVKVMLIFDGFKK